MKVRHDKHSIKGKLYSVAHPTKIHAWPSLVNYYPGPVCRAETFDLGPAINLPVMP